MPGPGPGITEVFEVCTGPRRAAVGPGGAMLCTVDVRRPDRPDDDPERAPLEPAPDGTVAFRVPTRVVAAKFGVAMVLALAALALASGPSLVIGLIAAALVAVYAVRDVLARERLRADPSGVVAVHGYAGRRHLPWKEIESVRVDARMRLGARTELLEIDADTEIFQFSRFDLGVEPDEALAAIDDVRPHPA